MHETARFHRTWPILLWSLFCAALILGLSLANKYWGVPDLWLAVIPVWWIGFSLCLVKRK